MASLPYQVLTNGEEGGTGRSRDQIPLDGRELQTPGPPDTEPQNKPNHPPSPRKLWTFLPSPTAGKARVREGAVITLTHSVAKSKETQPRRNGEGSQIPPLII